MSLQNKPILTLNGKRGMILGKKKCKNLSVTFALRRKCMRLDKGVMSVQKIFINLYALSCTCKRNRKSMRILLSRQYAYALLRILLRTNRVINKYLWPYLAIFGRRRIMYNGFCVQLCMRMHIYTCFYM